MKGTDLKNYLIQKAAIENRSEIEEKLRVLDALDIPDEAGEVLMKGLDGLMSRDAVFANKDIAEKFNQRISGNIDRAHSSKLQGMGFSETEISEVMALSTEQRLERIAQIAADREKTKYSQTESDRIIAEQALAKREKERADRLLAQKIEAEKTFEQKMRAKEDEFHIKNLIRRFEINNNIPEDKARKLIMEELNIKLTAAGARLVASGDNIRLVQADDVSLDYYDERNNLVNAEGFIKGVIKSLNLLQENKQPKPMPGQLIGGNNGFTRTPASGSTRDAQTIAMQNSLSQYSGLMPKR